MAIENKELATIKKVGQTELVTKTQYDEYAREIARCKRDIVYFCENYFRITNLDKGLHIVKLYDIQKEFINFMKDNNRVICTSGRQQGKCVCGDTEIKIRNKHTGEIIVTSIEDFFNQLNTNHRLD